MIDPNEYLVIKNIKNEEHVNQIKELWKEVFGTEDMEILTIETDTLIQDFMDYGLYEEKEEIWTDVSITSFEELARPVEMVGIRTVYTQIGERIYTNNVMVVKDANGLECIKAEDVY